MYTVKRFEKDDELTPPVKVSVGTVRNVARSRVYAVMHNGEIVVSQNPMTGKPVLETYSQKYVAQKMADYLNKKGK